MVCFACLYLGSCEWNGKNRTSANVCDHLQSNKNNNISKSMWHKTLKSLWEQTGHRKIAAVLDSPQQSSLDPQRLKANEKIKKKRSTSKASICLYFKLKVCHRHIYFKYVQVKKIKSDNSLAKPNEI